jgi:hypothetical protein
VHHRLHQAALAKQRALKTLDDMDDQLSEGRGSNGGKLRNRRGSSKNGTMSRSSSNMMPRGQYKMMIDQ